MAMDDVYREHILDHYKNPRNFGDLPRATHRATVTNASCGDVIELALDLRKEDEKLKIERIRFKGTGCAISMAAASLLTELIGKGEWTIDKLKSLDDRDMMEMLGVRVSPTRMKCATLPLRALEKALLTGNSKLKMQSSK
jgi:nitrogen fixation NifU-like protein